MESMRRRILDNTCFDISRYNGYYFTPLDFVSSPDSIWYDDVKHGIEQTFDERRRQDAVAIFRQSGSKRHINLHMGRQSGL